LNQIFFVFDEGRESKEWEKREYFLLGGDNEWIIDINFIVSLYKGRNKGSPKKSIYFLRFFWDFFRLQFLRNIKMFFIKRKFGKSANIFFHLFSNQFEIDVEEFFYFHYVLAYFITFPWKSKTFLGLKCCKNPLS
jgi:hypothetical protein